MNLYRKGRIAEKKVVNRLKERGFKNISRTKGSRGPYDIRARTPRGSKVYIQVKSGTARITSKGINRLRQIARRKGGAAAYVHYRGRGEAVWKWFGNWRRR